jgi:hypothetical protein
MERGGLTPISQCFFVAAPSVHRYQANTRYRAVRTRTSALRYLSLSVKPLLRGRSRRRVIRWDEWSTRSILTRSRCGRWRLTGLWLIECIAAAAQSEHGKADGG